MRLAGCLALAMASLPSTSLAVPVQVVPVGTIVAPDGAPTDRFGQAVAFDDGVALIGAPRDDDHGRDSGSAYAYPLAGGIGTPTKLTARAAGANARFGSAVAVSDGRALIGAPQADALATASGSAHLVDLDHAGLPGRTITAADGGLLDGFGGTVALDGDWAVIGADRRSDTDPASGVYALDVADPNVDRAEPLPGAMPALASSVAIDGDTALVGARTDDAVGGFAGAAFLVDLDDPDDRVALRPADGRPGDTVGTAVALEGDTALVGAPFADTAGESSGAASLYHRDGEATVEIALRPDGLAAGDAFGGTVALGDAVALVGASGNARDGSGRGTVYAFDRVTGALLARIVSPDPDGRDGFGLSLATAGGLVLVGAPLADRGDGVNQGAAHLYRLGGAEAAPSAVPVPASLPLLALGLMALGAIRRRA